ncbi:MAG: thiamine phosphate synthase [Acidobacteriaceae bacterium]
MSSTFEYADQSQMFSGPLPRLYPILDRAFVSTREELAAMIRLWLESGVTLLQYRNKSGDARQMLSDAREMVRLAYAYERREQTTLIMNDRADICLAAQFDGVHLGQEDLSPGGARVVVGSERVIGISCHNEGQIEAADGTDANYLAIGPIFTTASKLHPDPEVGLARLAAIRKLTKKPLVAIGGIDRRNCRAVIDAGADSVAVIRELFQAPIKSIADFHSILR